MTPITSDEQALAVLDSTQFSAHGYCAACAGWMVSDAGETKHAHRDDCAWVAARAYLATRLAKTGPAVEAPWIDAIMDGNAVLAEITERERKFTGPENVCAVLDAVARIARANEPPTAALEARG